MANNKTLLLANDVLRYFLVPAQAAPTRPTNLYIGLHTGAPGSSGAATNEVSAGLGYARQLVTFATESGGSTSNNNVPVFGPASASWGTINYISICKSNVAGTADVIYQGPLTTPRVVNTGGTTSFAAGTVVIGEN